jgi:Flp pilus assembly protein TadG
VLRQSEPGAGLVAVGRGAAGSAVRSDEAGSNLLLFPAAILVLLALGGIAVDSATLFLSQRRMTDLAAAVAHDAPWSRGRASTARAW